MGLFSSLKEIFVGPSSQPDKLPAVALSKYLNPTQVGNKQPAAIAMPEQKQNVAVPTMNISFPHAPVRPAFINITSSQNQLYDRLIKMRQQAQNNPSEVFDLQLTGRLSLAYWLGLPPEPWELYETARVLAMPRTEFYVKYRTEIIYALAPYATRELLADYGDAVIKVANSLTAKERFDYFHITDHTWGEDSGLRIPWADTRESKRKIATGDPLELQEQSKLRAEKRLALYRQKYEEDPSQKRKDAYERELRIADRRNKPSSGKTKCVPIDKAHQDRYKKIVDILDQTPDFIRHIIFPKLRQAENAVRQSMGISPVGEGWVNETELFHRVKQIVSEHEVIQHGKTSWLGKQHLDIWIPSLKIAIEYQGEQHFRPVARFGGEAGHESTVERDERKRGLCVKHGVRLIEISFDTTITDEDLRQQLLRHSAPIEKN